MTKYLLIFSLLINFHLLAKTGNETGLKIPRFVSLKSNEVNLRVGPSKNYPINIKYIEKNLPIEVIDEFKEWRKIKDFEENIGWLHKSLIKGERYILTGYNNEKNTFIYNRPNGEVIGNIKKNNIFNLKSCLLNWCKIYNKNLSGWVYKNSLWGVYDDEIYKKSYLQSIINQYWKILDSELLKAFRIEFIKLKNLITKNLKF